MSIARRQRSFQYASQLARVRVVVVDRVVVETDDHIASRLINGSCLGRDIVEHTYERFAWLRQGLCTVWKGLLALGDC